MFSIHLCPNFLFSDAKKSAEVPKSANQEPSYFEIPTKDAQAAAKAGGEAPSRAQETGAPSAAEPSHGHASFTIEFDSGVAGKVNVKDRVAKVGPETKPRPKRGVGEELSPLQTAMVAAEVKVADWLAQNELPLTLKEIVAEEDGESVKSDVPVHLRSLKGTYVDRVPTSVFLISDFFSFFFLTTYLLPLPSQTASTRTEPRVTQRMHWERSRGQQP